MKIVAIALWVLLTFIACRNGSNSSLQIESVQYLKDVPSGSGIALHHDSLLIVGDDATNVFLLNTTDYGFTKIPLQHFDANTAREKKKVKHDFETASILRWNGAAYLTAFGSGSVQVYRDSLLLLNLANKNEQRLVSVGKLYKHLMQATSTDSLAWNIEASVTTGDSTYIFNRGNNMLIAFSTQNLLQYLLHSGEGFPASTARRFSLPQYNGKQARISGACSVDNNLLLLSASIEDAPDWFHDGPILGSFVGLYSLKENRLMASGMLRDANGKVIAEKLESIELIGKSKTGRMKMLAIADNDDGSSKLYHLGWSAAER